MVNFSHAGEDLAFRYRSLLLPAALVLALGLLYVVFNLVYADFIVNLWWFESLGYGTYFWLRLIYPYGVFAVFTLLFFLVFFLNFWVASRFLGTANPGEPASRPRYQELAQHFRTGSLKVYTPFSLLLAVIIALPLYGRWEETLLYLFSPAAGQPDPVFGKALSYYLFSLPIYLRLFQELLLAFVLLFLGLVLLYWLESRLLTREARHLPRGAQVHLSILVLLVFFMGVWHFLLQRHQLLYTDANAPLFFGPGFVEMRVILPLIWVSLTLLAATAFSLIFYIHTRRGLRVCLAIAAVFFLCLGARYSAFLPGVVQRYIVKPNELAREKTYIARNIQATLAAFGLDRIETREYPIEETAWDTRAPHVRASLRNIPVWDKEVLHEVYQQLQELRTYYNFTAVAVDRYTVRGLYQQVFLAPRELNLKELPAGVRNWTNERLKYTHGYGVVMTPAAQGGEEPMTWFIQGIPPRSDYGLRLEQPDIYFGLEAYTPVIVPNASGEMGHPTEGGEKVTNYHGQGGVPISSLWRKLIFAVYFQDKNIFFTTQTTSRSRILFRRNLTERIKTITPFLVLDQEPYIVVTPGRLYWIQDAYTVSDRYPYAQTYQEQFNYLRNSVKIVVDAYDGRVDYYVADPKDPIVRAYARMYPGLFQPLDRLPAELKPHLRYPKDLMDIQMTVYAKYHQTDPEVFYNQEDLWEFPEIRYGAERSQIKPYYLTQNLIDKDKFEFVLLCPMIPKARANLRALCLVGCDGDNYGRLMVYSFPKGVMVYGPPQVDAFIEQDTVLSEQFTLWNQVGSQVIRGKMIVLPVRGAIVYVQPVYLKAASGVKIPQLKRLIVSQGELVVMEPTLEKGLEKLSERLRGKPRQGETTARQPAP